MVANTFDPTLGRQKQEDLCELEVTQVYGASSRIAQATEKPRLTKPK